MHNTPNRSSDPHQPIRGQDRWWHHHPLSQSKTALWSCDLSSWVYTCFTHAVGSSCVPITIQGVYCKIPLIGHMTCIIQSEAKTGDDIISLSANQNWGHISLSCDLSRRVQTCRFHMCSSCLQNHRVLVRNRAMSADVPRHVWTSPDMLISQVMVVYKTMVLFWQESHMLIMWSNISQSEARTHDDVITHQPMRISDTSCGHRTSTI